MASTETKTFKNFIAGEWVDAASGETFETTVPATGETLGTFPKSGPEDVDRAVDAAKAAYEEWRLVPAPKRGEILFRFGQLLADQKDDLALLMAREMGKVLPEAAGDKVMLTGTPAWSAVPVAVTGCATVRRRVMGPA